MGGEGAGGYGKAGEVLGELHAEVGRAWGGGGLSGGFDGGVEAGAAAVEVDAYDAGGGDGEHEVGDPEGGGEGVADARAASAVAGDGFVEAVGCASGGVGGGVGSGDEFIEFGIVFLEETLGGHGGIAGGAHAVVVGGEEGGFAVGATGEGLEPGVDAVFGFGAGEGGVWDGGADGFGPVLVLGEVLVEVVAFGAEDGIVAVAVDLVAEDEGDEARAEGAGDEGCFVGGAGGGAGGEVEGVDEAPVGGIEKGAEVADGCARDDAVFVFLDGGIDEGPLPVVLDAVADAVELFGVLLAYALPWSDVAEVAAEAEDSVGGEIAEGGDEWGVARERRSWGCRSGPSRSSGR